MAYADMMVLAIHRRGLHLSISLILFPWFFMTQVIESQTASIRNWFIIIIIKLGNWSVYGTINCKLIYYCIILLILENVLQVVYKRAPTKYLSYASSQTKTSSIYYDILHFWRAICPSDHRTRANKLIRLAPLGGENESFSKISYHFCCLLYLF